VSRFIPTGTDLLTDKQRVRLQALFGSDEHVEVEATWAVYQRLIAAYRDADRSRCREIMRTLITSLPPPRTPPRHSPRLPQPHQLHRQITTRDRRIQTTTTPSV